ncbi:conjugal transfer protein TraT [uncultured Desulfovibrio sp.]|uniref:conjugal transfer protein TraT n=1 Tax=uncultured Desulfovibrio sp. TaxID=167968 RepID=UPI00280580A2|nr:conjugal transfer protein TraT [uncultured Desulfovibrio sp.]
MPTRLLLLPVLVLILAMSCACVRQRGGVDAEVRVLREGALTPMEHGDVPDRMYVDVRDMTGRALRLPAHAGRSLGNTSVTLVENPSEAGYILQISLLDEGAVDPETFAALVKGGYGTPARFSGGGASGLLADILLVQRKVPSHSRPSRARLKNITSRNAVGSSQMRLGLLIPHETPPHDALPATFADALARELGEALSRP